MLVLAPMLPGGRFAWRELVHDSGAGGKEHKGKKTSIGQSTHSSRRAVLHLANLASSFTLKPNNLDSNLSALIPADAVLTLPRAI